MAILSVGDLQLELLPEKAVYVPSLRSLLLSDVHLGKPETFQRFGVPVSSQVNQVTLGRLRRLCQRLQPQVLWILGDLFHSQAGLVDGVIDSWLRFLNETQVQPRLLLGNHDRPLAETLSQLSLDCRAAAVDLGELVLSHEPHPDPSRLNICGHIHPCFTLRTRLDRLRFPCFHWDPLQNRLTLPAFGEFTGGYEVRLTGAAVAYGIVETEVIAFSRGGQPQGL